MNLLAAAPPTCTKSKAFDGFGRGVALLLVGALSAACSTRVHTHPGHLDVNDSVAKFRGMVKMRPVVVVVGLSRALVVILVVVLIAWG